MLSSCNVGVLGCRRAAAQGPGLSLCDLGGTRGSFLGKTRAPSCTCCPVYARTFMLCRQHRLFTPQGPEEDREAESEFTGPQLEELREQPQALLGKRTRGEDSDEEEGTDSPEEDEKTSPGRQDGDRGCPRVGGGAVEEGADVSVGERPSRQRI